MPKNLVKKSMDKIAGRCCCTTVSLALAAVSLGTLFAPAPAEADTIFGLHGSAHLWRPDFGGSVGQSFNAFDISGQFSDEALSSTSVLLALEHPLPFIPNVQVRTTPLDWEGSSDSASGTLGSITINGEVDAELDLDMRDGTLYYEVLDNWVSTARQLDGFFSVVEVSLGTSDIIDINQVVPMLYGHARFDLPFSGLALGLRGNGIAFDDNNLVDVEAYVHLEFDLIPLVDVGIQGGVRGFNFDIDQSGFEAEASLRGAYVALTGHF